MTWLESNETLIQLPKEVRQLGGDLDRCMVNRCLERMNGWLSAAVATAKAEFPDFEGQCRSANLCLAGNAGMLTMTGNDLD